MGGTGGKSFFPLRWWRFRGLELVRGRRFPIPRFKRFLWEEPEDDPWIVLKSSLLSLSLSLSLLLSSLSLSPSISS